MKCANLLKLKFLVIILIIVEGCLGSEADNAPKSGLMYAKKGEDWPGLCNTGTRQSPVNIIENSNTMPDTSYIEVEYIMPPDAAEKKFYYDGDRVYLDINLGNVTYYNSKGSKETYETSRIELHFPSEHYVTLNGQTPRYALEVQIYHTLKKTDNLLITNQQIKVQKAVLSLLFTLGDLEEGDIFLNQLGISKYNTDEYDKFFLAKPNQFITRKKVIPATYGVGFSYLAFQGLMNLINADKHLFFYYGSESAPPCREEILWMVFAEPRSFAQPQFDYLLLMLAKNKKMAKTTTTARTPAELNGNKRSLILWDEVSRGKILSNHIGLKMVHRKSFFAPTE